MGNPNLPPSNEAAVAAVIDPDVTVASTVTSGWVSMATFRTVMAVVLAGTLGTSATVDAKLEQATDAAGTGVKDVTGKSITQLTQAGTDSDKQSVINCMQSDLDVANDFDHVRLSITVGVATSDVGGVVMGLAPAYGFASENDSTTVAEIVT